MKFLVVLAVLCIAFISLSFETVETDIALIKALAKPCQTEENASDQDLDDLVSGVAPTTTEGKCMVACMGKQYGMITSEDKLNKDVFVGSILMKDASKKDAAEEVADACTDATADDRCEAAEKIWECIKEEASTRSLDLKF